MKIKTKFFAWFLALCLVVGMAGTAFAAETDRTYAPGRYVQNHSMWMRSAPMTESAQVGKLPKNSVAFVQEVLNDSWGRVEYDGVSGWVSLLYSEPLDVELTVAKLVPDAAAVDFAALKASGVNGVMLCAGYADAENAQQLRENDAFATLYDAALSAGLSVGAYFSAPVADAAAGAAAGQFAVDFLERTDVSLTLPVFLSLADAPDGTDLPAVAAAFVSALHGVGFHAGVYCTKAQADAYPAIEAEENGILWVSDPTAEGSPLEAAVLWEYGEATQDSPYALSLCYFDYPNVLSRSCVEGKHVPREAWVTLQAPTCTDAGKEVRYCIVCREIAEERDVAPLDHTPAIKPAVAPTCTGKGESESLFCSVCGRVLEAPELSPAAGHKWVAEEQTDPETGETTRGYTCSVCGLKMPEIYEGRLGDVTFDGNVTAADARFVLRAAVELEDFVQGGLEFVVADVNADGALTAEDARLTLRCAVNLEQLGALRVQLPDAAVLERLAPQQEEPTSEEPTSEEPTSEEPTSEKQREPSALAAAVVELAKKQVGKPFASGATGPDNFDNSGFVYYCFNENDVEIPRLTHEIIAVGTQVAREELLPGDIVVFYIDNEGEADFAGIYIGNDEFISCNTEDVPTGVRSMDLNYWTTHFLFGRRVA